MPKNPAGKARPFPTSQRALRQFSTDIFQVHGHPTLIHKREYLRDGEFAVTVTQRQLGIDSSSVSQHVALLCASKLVTNRKVGNQFFYALRDPHLGDLSGSSPHCSHPHAL